MKHSGAKYIFSIIFYTISVISYIGYLLFELFTYVIPVGISNGEIGLIVEFSVPILLLSLLVIVIINIKNKSRLSPIIALLATTVKIILTFSELLWKLFGPSSVGFRVFGCILIVIWSAFVFFYFISYGKTLFSAKQPESNSIEA